MKLKWQVETLAKQTTQLIRANKELHQKIDTLPDHFKSGLVYKTDVYAQHEHTARSLAKTLFRLPVRS